LQFWEIQTLNSSVNQFVDASSVDAAAWRRAAVLNVTAGVSQIRIQDWSLYEATENLKYPHDGAARDGSGLFIWVEPS
jgi:hypothetical protein